MPDRQSPGLTRTVLLSGDQTGIEKTATGTNSLNTQSTR